MKDPRNEKDNGSGIQCAFCPERWPMYQMEKTDTDDWICPNCRLRCDYCEYYYPTNEIRRTIGGKACSDCMCDHDLMPLDKVELYDTFSTILRL
jgi:hypothetical protein